MLSSGHIQTLCWCCLSVVYVLFLHFVPRTNWPC